MTPDHVDFELLESELRILERQLALGRPFVALARRVPARGGFANPRSPEEIGLYRHPGARRLATADADLLERFRAAGLGVPTFPAAGPREHLAFDPARVRAAIVTTGGLAPGINSVVHSIVERHTSTYKLNTGEGGAVIGVLDGFKGLVDLENHSVALDPATTRGWLGMGGSQLGISRYRPSDAEGGLASMLERISRSLERHDIDILYVIGGDGTQRAAHELALANPTRSIMGIPKTMDNDLLWVWESFGFDTAVAEATRAINTLTFEAQSTRRVGIIKLFGAASGFVASNASLASGNVDLVLVPETLSHLDLEQLGEHWRALIDHVRRRVLDKRQTPHALLVIAEGVELLLAQRGFQVAGVPVKLNAEGTSGNLIELLQAEIERTVVRASGESMRTFVNEPRHYIRSVPANSHDQIFCERLGALAVDNALAGYTDCMISLWLTESVLVPLELVIAGKKCIPATGMFWKQVVSATGQPQAPVARR